MIVEVWSAGADADLAGILTRADEAIAAVRIEFEMGPDAKPRGKATFVSVADGSYLVSVTASETWGPVDAATIEDIVDTVLTNLREAEPIPRP